MTTSRAFIAALIALTVAISTLTGCTDAAPALDAHAVAPVTAPTRDAADGGDAPALPVPAPAVVADPVVPAAPAAAPAVVAATSAPATPTSTLTVVEAVAGSGLDRGARTLTGVDEVFFAGKDTVWAFASIANPGATETVEMVWKQGDTTRWSTSLEVGKSKGWRTWSRRTLHKRDVGAWTVEIVDAEGQVLGSIPFEVRELPIDLEARVDARIRPQASR